MRLEFEEFIPGRRGEVMKTINCQRNGVWDLRGGSRKVGLQRQGFEKLT